MSHMILRPKRDAWVLYPSDRPAEREFFDTEEQARKFAAKHYAGVEVILPYRQKANAPGAPKAPRPSAPNLTLGYFFAQAVAKKAEGQSR